MAKRTNRVAWGLAVALALIVLGSIGLLGVRFRPYWIARHRGRRAQLDGAGLTAAPLQGADLGGARLRGAKLVGARLQETNL